MSEEKKKAGKPVSKKKIVGYFVLAYLGAALLLVAAVLPAEYGIDPFGIGKVTGISKLAEQKKTNALEVTSSRDKITEGIALKQEKPFKSKTIRIDLEDLGELEHKLIMKKGDTVVFSWHVEGATPNKGVYFDLHGHPPSMNTKFPQGFSQSYGKGEQPSGNGAFTAPFDGYFGWFFLNLEEHPITIIVDVSGFWGDDIETYRSVAGEVIKSVKY